MRRPHLPVISLFFCLATPLISAPPPAFARAKSPRSSQKPAILAALSKEFRHATPNHVKIAPWHLTSLEVHAPWALAGVETPKSSQLDPITVLLHKQRGVWKIATLGTNLRGSGARFGVPRALWQRWNLGRY